MIISKKIILEEIEKGNIIADGVNPEQIKDQSIDVSLGEWININGKWIDITNNWYIQPGDFVLAYTDEFVGTKAGSNLLPSFKLKSSAGRNGILHTLAGHGEVGFFNRWAMEFTVMKPLLIKKGMLVGQIYFTRTEGAESEDYAKSGTYQKHSTLEEVKLNWKREDILPPNLKLK